MPRGMASFSHRPPPFEFPRAPLSPPETNAEHTGRGTHTGTQESQFYETEVSPAHPTTTPASAGVRVRKASSIPYHSSGLKESRERIPQRSPKAFVIVIPPMPLIQVHGQLGHTLASGPRHRLPNGLLMPLFPTMYGQLTAIAREFNFPSTTGLCLYPQFVDNGVTMTPRISDEYWPFLWAHVFEASPGGRSPISGNIEFDIDMVQARWYPSWLASSHRDGVNQSSIIPSTVTLTHERGETQTTFPEDNHNQATEIHSSAMTARHVPRKLSLVDRYDTMSARSGLRPIPRSALSPPEQLHSSSHVLSPIFQDEEPKSARQELDTRVNSWRASAVLKPTSLAAKGQTSLEPANMPNSLSIDDSLLQTPDEQLNLEDFAWSVTSAGPSDYDTLSPVLWDRVPSVDIGNRMAGSVCLTPSDCTSFGPPDYMLPSSVSSIYRLPSPDIAYRMLEDAPPTPMTATSWGIPTDYPPSPMNFSRPPSLDLGDRGGFSRPVTPRTATSWGPASWPSSPLDTECNLQSVHLGDRGDFSRPVTPSTATSWGAPLSYPPSPMTPFYVSTPDAGHRGFEYSEEVLQPPLPSEYSWSHDSMVVIQPIRQPWGHIWPYYNPSATRATIHVPNCTPSSYPRFAVYQSVYPYFDLYPDVVPSTLTDNSPKHLDHKQASSISIRLASHYPTFDLYPATYPYNLYEIYPLVSIDNQATVSMLSPQYPLFELYPEPHQICMNESLNTSLVQEIRSSNSHPTIAGKDKHTAYPHFELYPPSPPDERQSVLSCIPVSAKASYPFFNIYPDVYPHFNLYPALAGEARPMPQTRHSLAGYPDFALYPPPATATTLKSNKCSIRPAMYPVFNLYPAVYPTFDIYPRVEEAQATGKGSGPKTDLAGFAQYGLYPTLPSEETLSCASLSTQLPTCYPRFNLYPSVYPLLEIYPAPSPATPNTPSIIDNLEAPCGITSGYPSFILYPAVYPYFDLYPAMTVGVTAPKTKGDFIITKLSSFYPAFELYPAVYPYFDLWPPVNFPRMEQVSKPRIKPYRLTHKELHAIVMMERIRSTDSFEFQSDDDDKPLDMVSHSIKVPGLVHQRILTLQPTSARLTLPKFTGPGHHPPSSQARDVNRLSNVLESLPTSVEDKVLSLQPTQGAAIPRNMTSPSSTYLSNGSVRHVALAESSVTIPTPSHSRRRGSLVSHRISVYNGCM